MASRTSGEGTSYEGGGGAGGKFRKKPIRRSQATPYDRPPPPTLPNPRNNGGWLPKLVDPASKLIFATARMFFSSSLFRKRLAPPSTPAPLPPEANQESRDRLQEAVPNNSHGVQVPATDDGANPTNSFDGNEISKLEQILKQKTFTRSEIERLTELLHSKTSDLPNGDEAKTNELNVPQPVIKTHLESHRFNGHISTPVISSQVCAQDVASPAELAKAYMDSNPSEVSPSMLGLRRQAWREDTNLLDNVSFPSKAPVMPLVPKPAVRGGVLENGFMNPRSRGRSAIYNMARTPNPKVNPTATQKGSSSVYDGYGRPSASTSSPYAWDRDGQRGSKQLALKRRSAVLEDDIGSISPIRRLRQKTSLLTPNNLSLPVYGSPLCSRGTGVGSNGARPPISLIQNEDNCVPSTSYTPVPSKSTEMATRILQQLEMLVPKEKSSEGKVVTGREKSPSKLTLSMLRGQALRSLEDVDSSKILQNALDTHKLEDLRNSCLPDAHDTTSQKQDKVEENGPKKFVVSRERLAPAVISDVTASVKHTVAAVNTADSVVTPPLTQPPQKKWAFQMSAHEDFLDLDDDIDLGEATYTLLAQEKGKKETSMVESKAAYTETVMVNKTLLSEIKPLDDHVVKKSSDLGTSDVSVAVEKNTSFTFDTVPASSTTFQPVVVTLQSTSTFDRESHSARPLFNSNSENVDKVPVLPFSSPPSVSEPLGLKFSAPTESKPESSNSLANIAFGAAEGVPKLPESDKGDNKETQQSGEMIGKSEMSSSAVSTLQSASSIFSFGAPANYSGLSNGSLASGPSIVSSPSAVPASSDFTNQKFGNGITNIASSTTATMTTNGTTISSASNGFSPSSAAPSLSDARIFKFGSTTAAPSNSVSTVSATSGAETTDSNAKVQEETSFGNLSTGSSIFGFSASAASSSANNLSQGSLFGTSSGSLVATQASPAETGVGPVTQSMPIMVGPIAASPLFGPSGTTSFTSNSSPFGSSTSSSSLFGTSNSSSSLFSSSTPPKVFDPSSSFGLCSSSSSPQTNTISSSGTGTSSLFVSSWQPTTTFTSPSTGFAFGVSSASVAAANNAPMVFGSSNNSASSGSIFSFTSASAPNAASSQSQPVFGSPIPAFTALSGNGDQMSMEDSMSEDPVQASTSANPVFGQPPIPAPSSGFVFGQPPNFQFGNQQNQSNIPQIPSPFQPSGSLEFAAGGSSFSLGSGGGDKSGRKIVKVQRKNRRRP